MTAEQKGDQAGRTDDSPREIEANRNIVHQLNEIVGKDIELKQKVDERLIGGVVVKVR